MPRQIGSRILPADNGLSTGQGKSKMLCDQRPLSSIYQPKTSTKNLQEVQIPSVTATCQRVTVSLATGVILPTAGTATRGKAMFLRQLRRAATRSFYFGHFP